MNDIEACLAGIAKLNERILDQPVAERRKHIRDRSVSVAVPDLSAVFDMRLTVDGLVGITHRSADTSAPRAQVRITVSSGDLVELAEDRLDAAGALLTRRLRVDASVGDLMRMRRML